MQLGKSDTINEKNPISEVIDIPTVRQQESDSPVPDSLIKATTVYHLLNGNKKGEMIT
jgi:hypothetical protein